MAGKMTLDPDFREFIQSLNDKDVRYLIVGGYAVAVHGYPRYTKDIDIWIELDPQNAEKVVHALHDFGFGSLGLTASDFLTPDQIIQIGYPPSRIDLLTTVPGVLFKNCYPRRQLIDIDGLSVSFIDLEDLKRNKRASGRAQDLADLENLT
jgi:predicted nucleotidyltransferase